MSLRQSDFISHDRQRKVLFLRRFHTEAFVNQFVQVTNGKSFQIYGTNTLARAAPASRP